MLPLDVHTVLRTYEAIIEDQLQATLDSLGVLASTQEVGSGDWQRIKPLLTRLATSVPTAAAV